MLLHEMFSGGDMPYSDVEVEKLLNYLDDGNRLKQPESCPDEMLAHSLAGKSYVCVVVLVLVVLRRSYSVVFQMLMFSYALVSDCWHQSTEKRPRFEHLRSSLATVLEQRSYLYGYLNPAEHYRIPNQELDSS